MHNYIGLHDNEVYTSELLKETIGNTNYMSFKIRVVGERLIELGKEVAKWPDPIFRFSSREILFVNIEVCIEDDIGYTSPQPQSGYQVITLKCNLKGHFITLERSKSSKLINIYYQAGEKERNRAVAQLSQPLGTVTAACIEDSHLAAFSSMMARPVISIQGGLMDIGLARS